MKNGLDITDRRIVAMLQENARVSNAEIARQVGKAPSVILERMRKLEKRGVVLGYEARINPKSVDSSLTVFTSVRTEEHVGSTAIGERLAEFCEVQEVHYTAGRDCYLLKVRVADTDALADLLKRIGQLKYVRDTNSVIVLKTVKETIALPINVEEEDG